MLRLEQPLWAVGLKGEFFCSPVPADLHPNFRFSDFVCSVVGMRRSQSRNTEFSYWIFLWQTSCIGEYCFWFYSITDKDCVL